MVVLEDNGRCVIRYEQGWMKASYHTIGKETIDDNTRLQAAKMMIYSSIKLLLGAYTDRINHD